MTKLKYGKVYITESDIKSALGITHDSHLEFTGKGHDGTIEFLVLASEENKQDWLTHLEGGTIANIRRHHIPFTIKEEGVPSLEELKYAEEYLETLESVGNKCIPSILNEDVIKLTKTISREKGFM